MLNDVMHLIYTSPFVTFKLQVHALSEGTDSSTFEFRSSKPRKGNAFKAESAVLGGGRGKRRRAALCAEIMKVFDFHLSKTFIRNQKETLTSV